MQNKPQLFCFSYAGSTASFFDEMEEDMPGLELVKLEYAGHGERRREPYYSDFDELSDDMLRQLEDRYSGGRYALLGYSMGTISLVEVLRKMICREMNLPDYVFLAAHEPHTKAELLGFTDDELDAWVMKRTIRFGGVPEVLLNNRTYWRTYLPLYRADYIIIGKYNFDNLDLRTRIPVVVFYSETDTPLKEMMLWENYFVGAVDYYKFEGGHFFIREHHGKMAEIISGKMGVNI